MRLEGRISFHSESEVNVCLTLGDLRNLEKTCLDGTVMCCEEEFPVKLFAYPIRADVVLLRKEMHDSFLFNLTMGRNVVLTLKESRYVCGYFRNGVVGNEVLGVVHVMYQPAFRKLRI